MHTRDLDGKTAAWYRFTETPGRVYGPRDLSFVFRAYGSRSTCETAIGGSDGQPIEPWFPASALRNRLKSQAVQPAQLRRLKELGVEFDVETIDKIAALELIEIAELRAPASPLELTEAKNSGAVVFDGMTRAQLNRALVPIEEAEEKADRQEDLAPRRMALSRRGAKVSAEIEEDELEELENAFEDFDSTLEEAKDWGVSAARLRALVAHTKEDCARIAARVQEWIALVSANDKTSICLDLAREREPTDKTMKAASNELFELVISGNTPSENERWFSQAVLRIEEDAESQAKERRQSRKPPAARQPSVARPGEQRRPVGGEKFRKSWIVAAAILILAILAALLR